MRSQFVSIPCFPSPGSAEVKLMMRLIILSLVLFSCTGCQSFLHELQPHRLWRLNYTDAPGRSDGSFLSIDDPIEDSVASEDVVAVSE